MILISHPTGNQNSRQAATAIAEDGKLHSFITALNIRTDWPVWNYLPQSVKRSLKRRDFNGPGVTVGNAAPIREALRLAAPRLKLKALTRHESGWASVDAVYRQVDKVAAEHVANNKSIDAVYAYEDGALETFRAAKLRRAKCIYELPIGYWRAHDEICMHEAQRRPEWADTWPMGKDSAAKRARKDAELALADLIVVASDFTYQTLRAYPWALPKIAVIPYGCPAPLSERQRSSYTGGPLKLLYVGGLTQRKGIAEILDVAEKLGSQVQLRMIGVGPGSARIRQRYPGVELLGSLSHDEVLAQMRCHDVLLFPSYFEGFGMVITEAMSQGMVVIASDRTGMGEVDDGSCSFRIAAGSSEALELALLELLNAPELLASMGKKALQKAAVWQWSDYRQRLRAVIAETLI